MTNFRIWKVKNWNLQKKFNNMQELIVHYMNFRTGK